MVTEIHAGLFYAEVPPSRSLFPALIALLS